MLDEEVAIPDGSSSRTTQAGKMDRSSSEVDVPDEEAQHSQQVVRVGSFLPRPIGCRFLLGESTAEVKEPEVTPVCDFDSPMHGRGTRHSAAADTEMAADAADLTYSQQRSQGHDVRDDYRTSMEDLLDRRPATVSTEEHHLLGRSWYTPL